MKPQVTPYAHTQLKRWWQGEDVLLEQEATRKGFGKGILEAAKTDKRIVALTANLGGSTGLGEFTKKYPSRFYDIGVAEQSLAGIAAGMASEGLRPVMTSFAVFSPGRNWDFIRTQIALNKHPVLIVGSHVGLATGEDGATHQALEDAALMRSLPHMIVISPGDADEAAAATKTLLKKNQPVYLRATRAKTPMLIKKKAFVVGKSALLIKGTDITIINTGTTLFEAVQAAKTLWEQKKISASVLHMPTIKPLDITVVDTAAKNKLVVTVEDHNIIGGLGSAVAERLAEKPKKAKLLRIGVNDEFGQSGTQKQLYKHYGLDAQSIVKKVLKTLKR